MVMPTLGQYVGHYRLVRVIGEGGMGMVFEGIHDTMGGRAAIKILRPEVAIRHELVARFFNEARAANAISHPGIVSVFDCGHTDNDIVYLAMEFLPGESLHTRLGRLERLPGQDALRIARQIASALQAAHARGVVHRDLKPENLIIVADPDMPEGERIKILDFGIAKLAEELGGHSVRTQSNLLMGTATYMAPEQCRGAKWVTDRSDVYALGVILYQMLAGRPPFAGDGVGELMAMHLVDPPPPLAELAPDVPPKVVALVHTMLEKQGAVRPSISEVLERLRRLSNPESEPVPVPAPAEVRDQPTDRLSGEDLRPAKPVDTSDTAAVQNGTASLQTQPLARLTLSLQDQAAPSSLKTQPLPRMERAAAAPTRQHARAATIGIGALFLTGICIVLYLRHQPMSPSAVPIVGVAQTALPATTESPLAPQAHSPVRPSEEPAVQGLPTSPAPPVRSEVRVVPGAVKHPATEESHTGRASQKQPVSPPGPVTCIERARNYLAAENHQNALALAEQCPDRPYKDKWMTLLQAACGVRFPEKANLALSKLRAINIDLQTQITLFSYCRRYGLVFDEHGFRRAAQSASK